MQGFSLIELLVVVAIIGILAAVGTVGYSNYMNSTKARVTIANAEAVSSGLKTKAAAANTGAGCSDWSTCYTEVNNDIKKNPYNSTATYAISNLTSAPSTGTASGCGTGLAQGQVGVLKLSGNSTVSVFYCIANANSTTQSDTVALPPFDFGQTAGNT